MINGIKRIFNNCDKVLKGIAIFNFIAGICITIVYDLFFLSSMMIKFMTIDTFVKLRVVAFIGILIIGFVISVISSFPLYGFAEIITQLKQINNKISQK